MFLTSLALIAAVNLIFFVFAVLRKTDVVTDLSYSLSFLLASISAFFFCAAS